MNKEVEKEVFLSHVTPFLEEYKSTYQEYFISLCSQYNPTLCIGEATYLASSLYENLFKSESDIQRLREELFFNNEHDQMMIGFLVHKSLFSLLEHYIEYTRREKVLAQTEHLIGYIGYFISLIEKDASKYSHLIFGEMEASFSETFSTTNTILEIFQKIKEEEGVVQFSNLYQGVPISCNAFIVEVNSESVTFHTERLQEIAMKLDGQAFIIKNDYFSKHIKADILYSNFLRNTVTLHNFMYLLNMPALQRKNVRVHPDIVAKVYLHQSDNRETSGRLYDLSSHGLGVLSNENNGIDIGAKVWVTFYLSTAKEESLEKIEVEAKVINIFEYQESFRYCMQILPNKEMSQKIVQYIRKREKEIIQNLEDELKEYII